MRIGIYADLLNDSRPTGIGLHIKNLVAALSALDDHNEYFLYYQRGVSHFSELGNVENLGANFCRRAVRFPREWVGTRPRLWWDHVLPAAIRRDRIDVFHGPNHLLPSKIGCRCIVTIHDLAYFFMEVHGARFDNVLQHWTRRALQGAHAIIALSESTRADLLRLGVPEEKAHVIYGGGNVIDDDQIQYARADEVKEKFGLPSKYILFVGSIQPRKNVPFLLRAYARWKANGGVSHGLVLAGQRANASSEVEEMIQSLGLERDVVITGYVESWELPLLYRMADAFVLPTRYEGFTLVTLEAMTYGVPVIATDSSSIREGTGDAAILVGVDDDEALAAAIGRVLEDSPLRRSMIEAGRARAPRFTWRANAEQTLELYRAVVGDRHRVANRQEVAAS